MTGGGAPVDLIPWINLIAIVLVFVLAIMMIVLGVIFMFRQPSGDSMSELEAGWLKFLFKFRSSHPGMAVIAFGVLLVGFGYSGYIDCGSSWWRSSR